MRISLRLVRAVVLVPSSLLSLAALAAPPSHGPVVVDARTVVNVHNTVVNVHNTLVNNTLVAPQPALAGGRFRGDFTRVPSYSGDPREPVQVRIKIEPRPPAPKQKPTLMYAEPPAHTPETPNVPRQVLVKSWGARSETSSVILDPWEASFKGFNAGEHVVIEKQLPSHAIESLSTEPISLEGGIKMAARSLLRGALRFEKVLGVDIADVHAPHNDDYKGALPWSGTANAHGTEELEVHAPLRIRGYANDRPAGPSTYTNVKGLATEQTSARTDTVWTSVPTSRGPGRMGKYDVTTTTKSGELQKHYAAWMRPENVRVSPAYRDAEGKPRADFVSLAAFPIGAKVRVTNLDLARTDPAAATVELQRKRNGRVSKTGSVIHGLPVSTADATYRLEVEFTGRHDAAKTVRLTSTFKLPDARTSEVQKGGIALYPFKLASEPQLTEQKETGLGDPWRPYYTP